MKNKIALVLLMAMSAMFCAFSQNVSTRQEPERYIVRSDDGKPSDTSKYKVVRSNKCLKLDFMNISENELIAFLKGELEVVDHQNKIIFQFSPSGKEIETAIKIALRNSLMDAIKDTFHERMAKYGPSIPNKPADKLTDEEIAAYSEKCQEYLNADLENVNKMRGLLQELHNLGFANEADILKKELNRRKNANKEWVDRYPREIVRIKTD